MHASTPGVVAYGYSHSRVRVHAWLRARMFVCMQVSVFASLHLRKCAFMCVCVFACLHACLCVCTRVNAFNDRAFIHVYADARVDARTRSWLNAQICARASLLQLRIVCVSAHLHDRSCGQHMCICADGHLRLGTYAHEGVHVRASMQIVRSHGYIQAYTHTRIHAYLHEYRHGA